MPHHAAFALALLTTIGLGGAAAAQTQPIVVELFTSQSCSSCPPADALLAELARGGREDLLPLSFHVTYWDRLGWRDRFSLAEATNRQRRYAETVVANAYGRGTLYTPQIVVQGRHDAVGSNRNAVRAAIAQAAAAPRLPIRLAWRGESLALSIPAAPGSATIWLIGFDREHVTAIAGGENRGRTLRYSNVVRSLRQAGSWEGQALDLVIAPPPGERAAVLLQAPSGWILGATVAPG
jgi:hypothetical protein